MKGKPGKDPLFMPGPTLASLKSPIPQTKMGALSKSFSPFYKSISTFFRVLPEVFRFLVLTFLVLWISCRRQISKYEYMRMINKKSSRFVYRRNKLRPAETIDCPICLSEFVEGDACRELQCRHVFHKNCLEKWLYGSRPTCPLCRESVLPEEIVSEHKPLQGEQAFTSNIEEELALILLSAMHAWRSFHGFF